MKPYSESLRAGRKKALPGILALAAAALAVCLAPPSLHAAEIQVRQILNDAIEVTGGTGDRAWHIRYGSVSPYNRVFEARQGPYRTLALAGPGQTAYFSRGNWLRRVDVEKGIVTGRWRFPGIRIVSLAWNGDRLNVEVEDDNKSFRRVLEFNPDSPSIRYWNAAQLVAFTGGSPNSLKAGTTSARS